MSLYSKRGVSAQKEEVHAATRKLDPGLYPNAFCKIYPDILGGDDSWINIMHADGAGTKTVLAYLYWKETGDISIWKGIAQDAIVMNLDDMLCTGISNNLLFSSTIDRNKHLIPGEILEAIITGSQEFFDKMHALGINITFLGGETADVGDVVRTIAVNGTMAARWPKTKLITNDKIRPGQVIIGLAGFGKANYESEYNSGIGSNGLTSARHDILGKRYASEFPETYDTSLDSAVVYIGKYKMTDQIKVSDIKMDIGHLLLSPTRTFAPVMKEIFNSHFNSVYGMIHCSGGGQTKCLNYVPANIRIIKDNLFEPPVIFKLIQEQSGSNAKEMYEVFNMGTRMEIYTDEKNVDLMVSISKSFNVDARVIGRVEASTKKELIIKNGNDQLLF